MSTIQYHIFDSGLPGDTIAIFGGIHGNETSGIQAALRIVEDIREGNSILAKGRLIVIPLCNPLAHSIGVRYVEKNLNRCFMRTLPANPCQEELYAHEIMDILETYQVSKLMDLHSTSGPSIPFMFVEEKNLDFAQKLGISHVIIGWDRLGDGVLSGDSEGYMNSFPGRMGFTFEAGNHNNPEGAKNAYQMALNFLVANMMIDMRYSHTIGREKMIIKMKDVYILEGTSFEYAIPSIENFSLIAPGSGLIGYSVDEGGTRKPIFATPGDILVMPKAFDIHQGEEVFFLGESIPS
ncbi:MAG: succinylglutamate desuccinylase/aspartoacylase family protein [Candidatus Gracilibacteria bacterium]|nr:succinylglutamate desuccinylase/aspartoacylase family protein [Candidatus Gracilibacteria bacterium]